MEGVTISAEVELMTVRDAATEAGVSHVTVYSWIKAGRVRSYVLGPHATVIPRADVEKVKTERMQAE